MRPWRRTDGHPTHPRTNDDTGAASVEMAIVTPLLLVLLFGIIQYGMLFHTMQAASATARDAASEAAKGIEDCDPFVAGVRQDAAGNGIPTNPDAWLLTVQFDTSGSPPNTYGTVTVDLAYTPQSFITFIPMPGRLHQTAVLPVQDVSLGHVTTCPVSP